MDNSCQRCPLSEVAADVKSVVVGNIDSPAISVRVAMIEAKIQTLVESHATLTKTLYAVHAALAALIFLLPVFRPSLTQQQQQQNEKIIPLLQNLLNSLPSGPGNTNYGANRQGANFDQYALGWLP